jgi:adhesin transport system outer membrane protein
MQLLLINSIVFQKALARKFLLREELAVSRVAPAFIGRIFVVTTLYLISLLVGVVGGVAQAGGDFSQSKLGSVSGGDVCSRGDGVKVLDCMINEAALSNPGVLSKRMEMAAAESGVEAAKWQFYPTPSIRAQQFKGDYMSVVGLRQPIWTGGKLSADLGVARNRLDVAKMSVDEVRYDIAGRIVSAYASVLASSGRREASAAGLSRLAVLKDMVARRLETRLGAGSDMELVLARLAQGRSDYAKAAADERSALAVLSQLVGRSLKAADLSSVDLTKVDAGSLVGGDVVFNSLNSSPKLRRMEADVSVAAENVTRAKAGYWPTLAARVEYQSGAVYGALPEGGRVYVEFEHSLDAGLTIASKVGAAEATREAARELLEAAKRDITSAALTDVEGYGSAVESEKGVEGNLAAMKNVAESYHRMFLAGKRSWLDLLNIIREQTDAEKQLSEVRVQKLAMAYRLKLDSGEFSWLKQQ